MSPEDIVRRATDPTASAWVSANAGAGKTYLLTDRVTRLLNAGAKPERILCLTYTKAAAAEMAKRLFERLGEWALLPDDKLTTALISIGAGVPDAAALRNARTLFAQALETPGGLKIQTIHSFCQHVLSRFPVEAGIPPRFTVLDERAAGEAMATARRSVLERAARGEEPLASAVATLAVRAADTRFADILDAAIAGGGKLRALLAKHGDDEQRFFAHLRKTLSVGDGEDENAVLTQFCSGLGGEKGDCERLAKWLLGGSPRDIERGERLSQFLASNFDIGAFALLRRALLKLDGQPFSPIATKDRVKASPDLAEFAKGLQDRLIAMEERRKAAITATLTEALIAVSLAVLKTYDRLKRERAGLDYDDLVRHTLGLLDREHAALWVLYKLDGGLEHILVDEAQDTSPEQWRIVAKLAEEFFAGAGAREGERPRTLFAVGDEKQSIFSFQGADPAQFGHHRAQFKTRAESGGYVFADLRPAISRRSTRAVLEFVDAVFANEPAREGLTASGDPTQHDPHRKETGRIEIWPAVKAPPAPDRDLWDPVDQPAKDSAAVQLAQAIAARIAGWLDDGTALPGSSRAIQPGDIMILVRRRNAFTEEMIRQLLERGVPVAGADRMVLSQQIAIADLVALGRFALLPEDDLTLAALLKSPLVGLPEDDLLALAYGRDGSLWSALATRKDERAGFAAAHDFLAACRAEADFVAPFEFYARALSKGLRKTLVARLGEEAADAIDEFLSLALAHESAHPPSLESFLDWFAKGASEIKRDMDEGAGQVRVMTVHGAKGLEANIVIVPDTAQVPDHAAKSGLLYTDDCVFFGVPKPLETAPVTGAKNAARVSEMREYRRLLYVALTRAREWLILCGYETKNGVRPESWYPHLDAAARVVGREEPDGDGTLIAFGDAVARGARATQTPSPETALPAFLLRAAAREPAPRLLRPSEAAGMDEFPATSPLEENGKRFERGLMVHALLARLPELTAGEREAAALAFLTRRGLDEAEARALAQETFAILNHRLFAPLFAEGSRAEVAVTAHLPECGARISGQIDRLAVTADCVLIADFKTNRPPPASAEETPALYRAQMALYRAALQKIYPGKRIDCALVWTDGARLMPLPAALLDAEIARITTRFAAT